MNVGWCIKSTKGVPKAPWSFRASACAQPHPNPHPNFLFQHQPQPHRFLKALWLVALLVIRVMSSYPSGWYPTTSSSSPSFNLFIPYTSSYSRDTHEMYNELGFILRPSKSTTPSPTATTKSKSSFKSLGSSFNLTKSRSYVNEMVRRLLKHTQLSAPSGHQVAFPIDKRRVAIAWPYTPHPSQYSDQSCSVPCLTRANSYAIYFKVHCTPQTEHHNNKKTVYLGIARLKIGTTTLISNYKFSGFRPGLSTPCIHCCRN